MPLVRPLVVAPDTSHWANWIDAALSSDAERRFSARSFHRKLLDADRIPFLSWHHLEEMLCVGSAENAAARVSYLQTLPLVASLGPERGNCLSKYTHPGFHPF